ncbi:hypothetical protein [Actinoplanes sp. TFC3]|nr:hypothetical protein [Actinoplanes sp. TFC3]
MERDHLVALDVDPSATGNMSQPFWGAGNERVTSRQIVDLAVVADSH